MAIFTVQSPDGRTVDLEGDSPPTEQELEQVFSSLPPPVITAKNTVSPQQQSIDQFIRSRQASPLSKIGTGIGGLFNTLVVDPVKAGIGAAKGIAEEMGTASTAPIDLQTALLGSINPLAIPMNRNIVQTGLEAGGRALFDIGNTINQLISQAASRAGSNPAGMASETVLGSAFPTINVVRQLLPSNPTQDEIDQFLQGQQRADQVEAVKTQPLIPEVIGTTNIPLAENIETLAASAPAAPAVLRAARRGLTGVARAVASPIQTTRQLTREAISAVNPTVGARLAPATMEDSIISSLNLGPDDLETVIPKVPTAVERTLQVTGKVPETAEEAIRSMKQARKNLYNERLQINNAAEQRGLVVNGNEALSEAEDVLNNLTTISDKQKTAILDDLKDTYAGEKSPSIGQKIQEDLNNEFSAAYANGTIDRANPTFQARLAIRDSIARQMDELGQVITGRTETPYSDIGNLIEVQGNLENTLNQLKVSKAGIKTGIKKVPGKVPTTRTELATKTGKGILTPFQKTQIEKLNDNVKRIFGEQIARPPILPLQQSTIESLREARSPIPVDLNQQIQNLINTYPPDIQRNPFLARAVAETELGIR